MAGTFKFWITSNRMLDLETCPISMLVVISPKHCRGLPLAVEGALWGEVNFHFSTPGSLELTHVTSDPVSNSHVHFTLFTFPRTCKVDLRCDHGRCGKNGALLFLFDTSGGPPTLALFSLKATRGTGKQSDPIPHN